MTSLLYGILEAKTHYMRQSSFDSCFFISINKDQLRIAALQTDDVLMVINRVIKAKEEKELVKSKLKSKEIKIFTHAEPMIFNKCKLSLNKNEFGVLIGQKKQSERLAIIKLDSAIRAKEYLEQRAREAYLITICYLKASYALSIAAQY
ncbi:polyprotein [Drepanopeziza brunnea f. sp. 'multigermtubi' MB_m1]|uniref:Polyprotein n=1 Tax=Marssonina brunnea f. sp. multigermtubi (strain MB_m1) TaxID=1072389 RepID=K1WLY2_MARBU|nr:polyprotein [Drepanopeziza brunnea f. sp. 'multigermtubi' MB_m1]EKD13317.1 polyprotein [Drepanopeziza brunnea f. sp. 'multigermtubi' MB_m1]